MNDNTPALQIIGHVSSCYKEKFGTPRQPGIVPDSHAEIVFAPEYGNPEAFRELDGFSHIWVLFLFHQTAGKPWRPTVRPPRLGGNRRVGVFASRSPFRPNHIGLSAVKLEGIEFTPDRGTVLKLSGIDLVDGTPVLDIKPYLPFTDCLPMAQGGYAASVPELIPVRIPMELEASFPPSFIELLRQTLATDPRPAFHEEDDRTYGLTLENYNVHWYLDKGIACVKKIEPLT